MLRLVDLLLKNAHKTSSSNNTSIRIILSYYNPTPAAPAVAFGEGGVIPKSYESCRARHSCFGVGGIASAVAGSDRLRRHIPIIPGKVPKSSTLVRIPFFLHGLLNFIAPKLQSSFICFIDIRNIYMH